MSAQKSVAGRSRLPRHLRIQLPTGEGFARTKGLLRRCGVHTVCVGTKCPNIFECFSKKVAAFMILGDVCTRSCAFCGVPNGKPAQQDPEEPKRIAEAAAKLGLTHVVVTSVTRDDLPDGGAGQFAAVVRAVEEQSPTATTELLIPDFQGDERALQIVTDAKPTILNHNMETVKELYSEIRPQAEYQRSLDVLSSAKQAGMTVKSGLMVGLGESEAQIQALLGDLASAGSDIVTIGQYLRPDRQSPEPKRYVAPEKFEEFEEWGRRFGIHKVHAGPFVRSSYNAANFVGCFEGSSRKTGVDDEAQRGVGRSQPDSSAAPSFKE